MENTVLEAAAADIQERSASYTPFVLGAHCIQGPNGDVFLLVGVNETVGEAVDIYEDWNAEWDDRLVHVGVDPMDDHPDVVVHEFRTSEQGPQK